MDKLTHILQNLVNINYLFELLPLIFCIVFFRKINTKALKVFFIYTISLAVFLVLGLVANKVFHNREAFFLILRVYSTLEFCLLALFLKELYRSPLAKKIIIYLIVPVVAFSAIDYMNGNKTQFNNHINIVTSLIFILSLIYYFFEKMQNDVTVPLYQSITFWLCVGLFLYVTGSFFFFIFSSTSDVKAYQQMTFIYTIVTISKNIILCLSLLAHEQVPNQHGKDGIYLPDELLDDPETLPRKNV